MVKVVSRIKDSNQILIKRIAAETNQLIQDENANIISLSQGVPNLPIFEAAYASMQKVLEGKKLPYTDVPGIAKVRDTAAEFINKYYPSPDKKTQYTRDNIILTAGGVQAVYNVLALSIENKDDVVVSPLPAYGLYKHQTELLGGTFQTIPTHREHNFVPTIEDLQSVFDANTVNTNGVKKLNIKSVVLCYPNNPVGTLLTEKQARDLANFLDKILSEYEHQDGFSVVLDEIYFGTFAQPNTRYHSILEYASPRVLNSCFLTLSASKGLGSMPGMRAGFCFCPNTELITHMIKVQQACTANSAILSQHGLEASLRYILDNPSALDEVGKHYGTRTNFLVEKLNEMGQKYFSGQTIAKKPEATFYVFADFSKITKLHTDLEIYRYFRDMYKIGSRKVGVAVVPGSAFGMDPHAKLIRFSCAVDMENLQTAVEVLDEALGLLA